MLNTNALRFALIFASITSLFAPLQRSLAAEVIDRLEAVVNKRPIFKSDVEKFRKLVGLRVKIDPLFAASPMSKKSTFSDEEIVQFLLNEELISQKYPVADPEVEQEINGIQTNLKIDRDGLKQAIAAEGYTFDDYLKLMKLSIAKKQLLEREIRSKAAVSEDDLKNEFNKTQFSTKDFHGSFHLFIIRLSKKNFKTAPLAKESAQKALDSIQKGDTFETVAKSISDDESAASGGDLGFLSYADLSPSLQSEVKHLGVGKLSSVLDDGKSFYLLRVTEVKADTENGFEKEKEQIRAHLMEDEFQHQIALWLDRQRSINYIKRSQKTST